MFKNLLRIFSNLTSSRISHGRMRGGWLQPRKARYATNESIVTTIFNRFSPPTHLPLSPTEKLLRAAQVSRIPPSVFGSSNQPSRHLSRVTTTGRGSASLTVHPTPLNGYVRPTRPKAVGTRAGSVTSPSQRAFTPEEVRPGTPAVGRPGFAAMPTVTGRRNQSQAVGSNSATVAQPLFSSVNHVGTEPTLASSGNVLTVSPLTVSPLPVAPLADPPTTALPSRPSKPYQPSRWHQPQVRATSNIDDQNLRLTYMEALERHLSERIHKVGGGIASLFVNFEDTTTPSDLERGQMRFETAPRNGYTVIVVLKIAEARKVDWGVPVALSLYVSAAHDSPYGRLFGDSIPQSETNRLEVEANLPVVIHLDPQAPVRLMYVPGSVIGFDRTSKALENTPRWITTIFPSAPASIDDLRSAKASSNRALSSNPSSSNPLSRSLGFDVFDIPEPWMPVANWPDTALDRQGLVIGSNPNFVPGQTIVPVGGDYQYEPLGYDYPELPGVFGRRHYSQLSTESGDLGLDLKIPGPGTQPNPNLN